jgi:hypothetical protein
MGQVSADTWMQLVLWGAVLLGLVVVATLIVQRLRQSSANSGTTASDLLTDFQDMRQRGDLSDADYKKVKSVLGTRLQPRTKDGKDTT